jgi:uncharacterized protein YndB with AHSA1/START domain
MTMRSATHATFVIERTYDASPAKVFAAWATADAKARWFGAAEGNGTYKLDFKVGGRESSRGDLPDGQTYTYDATFQDIVPNERIIYSYDMVFGGKRISVSVTTVELKPAGKGTKLTFTEQGVFLDGLDNPAQREAGTKQILDKLGTTLKA